MDSLFAQPQKKPLADRMRPTRLSDFVGQETAVGERSPLRRMIEKDQLQSVLFYGPPGTGKTTLAQVIAHMTGDEFVAINNEVVDYTHELGLTVWTHNCRGNYEIRYAAEGTYEDIAKKFLAEQHYDRFFLEWDSDTAGDIKALEASKTAKLKLY